MPWIAIGYALKSIELFRSWGCQKKVFLLTHYYQSVALPFDVINAGKRDQFNASGSGLQSLPIKSLQTMIGAMSSECTDLRGRLLPLIVESMMQLSNADAGFVVLNQLKTDSISTPSSSLSLVKSSSSSSTRSSLYAMEETSTRSNLTVAARGRAVSRSINSETGVSDTVGSLMSSSTDVEVFPYATTLESLKEELCVALVNYVSAD